MHQRLSTFSASKIKTFLECRHRYAARYIAGEPEQKNLYAVLGTAVHRAIEWYYTREADPATTFEKAWHEERTAAELDHANGLFYDGLDMLELYPFAERRPTALELSFHLPFPSADAPICMIRGFIDHYYADERMVWDIKTAKRKPSAAKLNSDPQFILYAWACEQLYGEVPTIAWYHARTAELLVADVHGMEKCQNILAIVGEMLAFHANPQLQPVDRTCFFCPTRARCRGEVC